MKKIFVICFVLISLSGCNIKNNEEHLVIDCNQKDELLKNGVILIDVRT